jgi:hypothetical protein
MNTLQKSVLFVLYLLVVYIFIHTYIYLENLNKCPCFQINPKYAVDIEFMKLFQILEIILFTFYFGLMASFNKKLIKKPNIVINIISSISLILLLGISGYMAYNVLNLYTNIKEDCKCANEFYKYFVYYEGILSISNVFRFVAIFVTLFIVILFNNLR